MNTTATYTTVARTTATHLNLRLDRSDKYRIAKAAALRSVPVSVFVREAVLREADAALATDAVVSLSGVETRRFLAALDAPFVPNARLQQAMDAAVQITQSTQSP